jgi:hypothetical protein
MFLGVIPGTQLEASTRRRGPREECRRPLCDMRQFVSDETSPTDCRRPVLARAEYDLAAQAEGAGADRPGGGGSGLVVVDAHPCEVVSESRLHERPRGRVEGLSCGP